jgi:hypothetical protein
LAGESACPTKAQALASVNPAITAIVSFIVSPKQLLARAP